MYEKLEESKLNYRFFYVGYTGSNYFNPITLWIYTGVYHCKMSNDYLLQDIHKYDYQLFDIDLVIQCVECETEDLMNQMHNIFEENGMKHVFHQRSIRNDGKLNEYFRNLTSKEMIQSLCVIHRLCKLFEMNDDKTIKFLKHMLSKLYHDKNKCEKLFNMFVEQLSK